MYKQFILNSILKEMKLVRRLATFITPEQLEFRPKEGVRNTLELMQYLSNCGTGFLRYWYRTDDSDFKTFYGNLNQNAQTITLQNFGAAMDEQMKIVTELFDKISEEDLLTKEVDYPWGEKAMLGQALLDTGLKWLTAYKLQLFLNMKLSSDQKLVTADLWRKTELETV